MSEIITVRVNVSTRYVGSKDCTDFEIEREAWESMSEDEQFAYINDYMWELIDCWFEVVDK